MYSRGDVNQAGKTLRAGFSITAERDSPAVDADELFQAYQVLGNWRACHNYPLNTFNATLRTKLKSIDSKATVARRLKRLPSIIDKLVRFPSMDLARMQDIGGLQAIVESVAKVRKLESAYLEANFRHQLVEPHKDYIKDPKADGYRRQTWRKPGSRILEHIAQPGPESMSAAGSPIVSVSPAPN